MIPYVLIFNTLPRSIIRIFIRTNIIRTTTKMTTCVRICLKKYPHRDYQNLHDKLNNQQILNDTNKMRENSNIQEYVDDADSIPP